MIKKNLIINPGHLKKFASSEVYYLSSFWRLDSRYRNHDKFLDISTAPSLVDDELKFLDHHYDSALRSLSTQLNAFHCSNFNSWECLIGPWLRIMIFASYVKWKNIKSIEKKGDIKVSVSDIVFKQLIPRDHNEFDVLFHTHEFHEHIFLLLSNFSNLEVKKLRTFNTRDTINRTPFVILKRSNIQKIKNFLVLIADTLKLNFLRFFRKETENIAFYNSLLSSRFIAIFHYFFTSHRLKRAFFSCDYNYQPFDRSFRFRDYIKLNQKPHNEIAFEELVLVISKICIPQSYLEGYQQMTNMSKSIYPYSSRLMIFSSTAHWHEDIFKSWIMRQKYSNNASLNIYQHGGTYGTLARKTHQEYIETKLADRFLTWGWANDNDRVHQMFGPISKKKWNFKTQKRRILIVLTRVKMFSRGDAWDSEEWNKEYLNLITKILTHSRQINTYKIVFRVHPRQLEQAGFDLSGYLKNINSNVYIDEINSLEESISSSSLVISTQNSTVFLQSLKSGTPTLGCWNSNLMKFNEETKIDFDRLKSLNIFFSNPVHLIDHILTIHESLSVWWLKTITHINFQNFIQKYHKNASLRECSKFVNPHNESSA